MRVDVSGLVGGVLTGHSCPPEPSVPCLMVLSAPEGWTPLYLSCIVMAAFGNLTLASVSETPSPRFVF